MRNPGQFDSTAYAQRKGIYSKIDAPFASDCRIESHGHGNPLLAFGFAARRWIQGRLALDLAGAPESVALIDGVVLGMAGETPEEMRALFQRTGTVHLFAVSGLNVAMLATIAFFLLQPLRLPRGALVGIIIALLAAYTLVTGLRTSSVRSTIMATMLLAAPLFDRRAVSSNSLAAAAFVILAWDTNELFAPGFQFSFTLVFIIILAAGRIRRRIEPLAQPDPFLPRVLWSRRVRLGAWGWHRLCAALGIMIASWFGSLIFMAGYFHLFSPSAFFANLLAVPLAFAVLALGLATTLSAPIWLRLALLFNNANWLVAKAFLFVLRISAEMPGGYIYVEWPHFAPSPACELTVLDLGEGGGIHLRSGARDWLLDCGSGTEYNRTVLPYLRSRGVNSLDGLLLTHGDAHHIAGAFAALDDFRPRCLVDSPVHDRSPTRSVLHAHFAARRIGKAIFERGDFLRVAPGASLRVLFPPAGLKRNMADDKAFVLQLESAGTRVLFMSDSGFSTEQWLLENEPDLRSDVLVKGHHAKDISGTPDFLARVQPQAVICTQFDPMRSVAPLDAWEKDVVARGIAVFRQDRTGAVRV
ncbi:MAG TPA: ComEC/Rec2 family competence protein, partial [Chthoniobacteraceae bacterium]|nr:ComEC/Rec2 family competence protein [Chthoniobacteraceae bacterium]